MIAGAPSEMDDRFLHRVYRLSTILALLVTAIGSLFSLGAILSLDFVIRRMVKPGSSTKTKRWLGFIALGKFTIIFVGFGLLTKADWLNVYTLAAGVGLVQVVIILKAHGLMTGILFKGDTTKS